MPATVELSPLFDPTLDRVGFPLDHPYIERVYCSVLGPSSVLPLRRAGELFAERNGAVTVDLSRSLGLGGRPDADDVGRNAQLRRTIDRLARRTHEDGVGARASRVGDRRSASPFRPQGPRPQRRHPMTDTRGQRIPTRHQHALTSSPNTHRAPLTFSTPPACSRTAQPSDTHLQVSLSGNLLVAWRSASAGSS